MHLVRCEMSVSKSSRASIPPISANSLKKVDDLREAMPCDKPAGPVLPCATVRQWDAVARRCMRCSVVR